MSDCKCTMTNERLFYPDGSDSGFKNTHNIDPDCPEHGVVAMEHARLHFEDIIWKDRAEKAEAEIERLRNQIGRLQTHSNIANKVIEESGKMQRYRWLLNQQYQKERQEVDE